MSPAFIIAFKKKFKCARCGHQKLSGYSLCPKHVLKARRHWHTIVKRKMILGECVNCHRKHVRGEQRCDVHKEINRKRIHNWSQAKYWARRRDGLCVDCLVGQAKPVVPGSCCRCEEHREWRLARLRLRNRS
jgi:hypothetical protein